jgi:serine/threonine protein kinase
MKSRSGPKESKMTKIDSDLRNLLQEMIQFKPDQRQPIAKLLQNPLFKDIRVMANEVNAEKLIDIQVDSVYVNKETGEEKEYSRKKLLQYMVYQFNKFTNETKPNSK